MASGVHAIVLDVNETLFSLDAVEARFEEVGLTATHSSLWFAKVLRDGFGLAATSDVAPFPEIGAYHLRRLLVQGGQDADEETVAHVLQGFQEVQPHADIEGGLQRARDLGLGIATLTNGSEDITRKFLERHDLLDHVDDVLAAVDSGVWKPHADAYHWAASKLGQEVEQLMLVAVHPWDIHGAAMAGLRTGWLDRAGAEYPDHFRGPDASGGSLGEVVDAATRLSDS